MNVGPSSSRPIEEGHHLLLELGRGGTAHVFLAVQSGAEGVDKLVVLKFLRPDFQDNAELREMFINEARFSARLNHANIVQTSAIVQTTRGAAIVLEYLEGQPLSVVRSKARTKLPLEMHLRIIIDVLRGLHYAHELTGFDGEPLDVVHRDVSPHNVFVTYDGQVKLIDFGIAKLLGTGAETATGVIKGKIGYMPPEQIEGNKVDRRADLYAVGVMLWEAATGERLWKGLSDVVIMNRVLNGNIPRPRDANPDVPEELERIIVKALSFSREARYATAPELEVDLEVFLAGMIPVTNRDIGRFVSREFEELRTQTRRIIGEEMKRRASTVRSSAPVDVASSSPPPLSQSLARAGYATMTSSDSRRTDAQGEASRPWLKRASRSLFAAAVLAIGVGVVLGVTFRSSRSPSPSVDAGAALAPPPPSPTPVAPAAVTASGEPAPPLREETVPSSGSASVAVAAAPSAQQAEPSAKPAEPSAQPARPSAKQARPSAKPARPTAKQAGSSAKAPDEVASPPASAAKPAPAAPVSPPSVRCDPPYTIDADGIKRFKVECM
ncbi:protein kinase [Sorangium sp. So ce590]|uniref:serine/threonine protein kinase n=1 Tax=Sorangium sp. So ce590 TaxID=3133317 RepID=UPI003F5E6D50